MGWGHIQDIVDNHAGAAVGTAALPGVGTLLGDSMYDQPREAAQAAHDADVAEQQRRDRAIQLRDANLTKLRSLFGIGNDADAAKHAGTIAEFLRTYYQGVLQQGLGQSEQAFADTSRTSRQNLARVGQLDSGLDAGAQSSNLADFIRARQRAISGAASARDALSGQLTTKRLGLESQISGGQMANPDFGSIAADRNLTLSQAQQNIPNQAIGDLFNTAGSTYFNGRVQEAQGNQGLQAFGFTANNEGRIS